MSQASIAQALQGAIQHHQAGRLPDAEAMYRQILAQEPRNVDALHLLGVIAIQAGRYDSAIDLIRRAISLKSDFADAYNNLGTALQNVDDFDGAVAAHRKAIELKPRFADAIYNLGILLQKQGKFDDAIEAYSQVVQIEPNFALGHNNLGIVYAEKGEKEKAAEAYSRAVHYQPDFFKAYNNLGLVLMDLGRSDEAITAYSRAIQIKPDYAIGSNNLANAYKSRGQLDQAIAVFKRTLEFAPTDAGIHSNLVYTLSFHPGYDAAAILEHARQWDARHGRRISPSPCTQGEGRGEGSSALTADKREGFKNDPLPDRRLKIGYISPDLRNHPVGRSLLPLLVHRDRDQFEIFCYYDARRVDPVVENFKQQSDHWREVAGLSNQRVAEMIRADAIDILADTTLHTSTNRLAVFAQKPAPVQTTLLGPPITTGLAAMDYRITDPYLDPPGSDADYSEQSIRLPHCFWLYQRQAEAADVNPSPAQQNGFVTFGCLNQFSKVTFAALGLWAEILLAVPNSRLTIQTLPGSHLNEVQKLFAGKGISTDRVIYVARRQPEDYFLQYHGIDVSLDPFPFNGHTSTLDSFWMGVPTITLAGNTAVARGGVSLLSNLGLTDWIARTPEEYISIAAAKANNVPLLAEMRSTLRGRLQDSPLMDAAGYARDVEAAYRQMWRNWCSQ